MPERADHVLAEDASALSMWLKSEYFHAFERLMDDRMDDARERVLKAQVRSQEDFYAVLEEKGKYLGLMAVMQAIRTRIHEGERARGRLRGHT